MQLQIRVGEACAFHMKKKNSNEFLLKFLSIFSYRSDASETD